MAGVLKVDTITNLAETGYISVQGASFDLSSATSSIVVPTGTTAQRPSSPPIGSVRYNTDTSKLETYYSTGWGDLSGSSASEENKSLQTIVSVVTTPSNGSSSASPTQGSGYLGSEFISATITPRFSTSNLVISVYVPWMSETTNHSDHFTAALYRDSSTSAIAIYYDDDRYQDNAGSNALYNGVNHMTGKCRFDAIVQAQTTSPTRFSFTAGCNGGAVRMLGGGGGNNLNTNALRQQLIMTVTEYKV